MSLKSKAKIIFTFTSQLLHTDAKVRQWRKLIGGKKRKKKLIHLQYGGGGELYGNPATRKTNKWVLEQIKAWNIAGGKWQNWSCSTSSTSWEIRVLWKKKKCNAGKREGSKKKGRPNMRWIDSIKKP